MRGRLRVLLAVVSGVLLVLASAPAAAVAQRGPAVPTLAWHSCGPDLPDVQCATATVPLDYDRPSGPTIRLALTRFPASAPGQRIGTLFLNPGGPGASGADFAAGFGAYLDERLHGRFDVVGFDPRGVASSTPLRCFASGEAEGEFLGSIPVVFPYTHAQARPYFDTFRSLGDRCYDRGRDIARSMSTADVARDLDLLRQAVGDTRLNYLGFSYGTYIGNTYANLFPGKIRAMVIDGVLDPQLWSSGWQIKSDRIATQKEFGEFLRLCDEAGPQCTFATSEGSAHRWERLARQIRRTPLTFPDGFAFTYDLLIADVTSAMYEPLFWPMLADEVDQLADAVLGGDPAAAARAQSARSALLDRIRPPRQPGYDNGFDAYYGNQCADTQYPHSFLTFKAVGAYAAAGSRFGPFWWWQNAGCADWPVSPDRYTGPWSTRTSAPVLVVGNYFDGVTDYRGAKASARLLHGRLLSYAGWGHTAYGRTACVDGYIENYLLSGALPPAGTVCPAVPSPFTVQSQRAAPVIARPPAWLLRD
jgi:pimeloyl-ACP methyl ester carboxylesterase